ncbi:MAG: 2-hydroxyacyl-CoA dehydratase [Firmicutes bacterium]|nr:2-hydroxyacyl-CoA dehydratase [Bacillota bacterium]
MGEERKSSKQLLAELQAKHYADAQQAKAEGKPVAWSASIAMQEILEAMDIAVVYPENHAAAIGARKESMEFINNAEGRGYSTDICSYARVNIGYSDIKHAEAQDIPLPDFVFCCDNLCNTVLKWYENLAKDLNIPMVLVNTPFVYDDEVPERSVKYMRKEFDHVIRQLEEITGKKMDPKRLEEVMETSNEAAKWWKAAYSTAVKNPSPLSGFDMFNYMAAAVTMRGKKETVELFRTWHDELKERGEAGMGPWKPGEDEKYRVLWDGIACWTNLSTTFKTLKKYGVNVVCSTYPDIWNLRYGSNDLDGLVKAYAEHYANRSIKFSVDKMSALAEEFQLDGILYHSNRSCKLMDFRQYEIQRQVEARTGIPYVSFDGDQTDPRIFSDAQYETRIQALVEVMENKKNAKGGK